MGLGDVRAPFGEEVRVEHFGVQSLLDRPDSLRGKTTALTMVHSRAPIFASSLPLATPGCPGPSAALQQASKPVPQGLCTAVHSHGLGQKTVACALTTLSPVV